MDRTGEIEQVHHDRRTKVNATVSGAEQRTTSSAVALLSKGIAVPRMEKQQESRRAMATATLNMTREWGEEEV